MVAASCFLNKPGAFVFLLAVHVPAEPGYKALPPKPATEEIVLSFSSST